MKKVYLGNRLGEGCEVYVKLEDGKAYPLPLHLEVRNHSPTGFNWGYMGSGAAQLALAILADYFGPDQPPSACPYCGSDMGGWKCSHDKICGYDGEREGDKWRGIQGGRGFHYQDFKRDFINGLKEDRFEVTSETIDTWALLQKTNP